jgi:hypothetical protein
MYSTSQNARQLAFGQKRGRVMLKIHNRLKLEIAVAATRTVDSAATLDLAGIPPCSGIGHC